jgi:hypothetical protein
MVYIYQLIKRLFNNNRTKLFVLNGKNELNQNNVNTVQIHESNNYILVDKLLLLFTPSQK